MGARIDIFLWIGSESIFTWDRRSGSKGSIPLLGDDSQWIPYVPKFYDIWENPTHYQEQLRQVLGVSRSRLWGKRRVLLAAPDDLTQIEAIALEDFIYAAMGGALKRRKGLIVQSHCQVLRAPAGHCITVTRSCRCYTASVLSDGEAEEKVLLDINECSRDTLLRQIREYHSRYRNSAMEVFYPDLEADWLLDGLGAAVSLDGIIAQLGG